jgi:hypothetical protein
VHVRVSTRRNKDGTAVRYLQLTHNEWDAATKTSRPKVLHSFGREDQLDRDAIRRLVASLTRLLDPATALSESPNTTPAELGFISSVPVGGTLVLEALWRRLRIDTVMTGLLEGGKRDPRTERVLFGLVANRALEPGSKLAAARAVAASMDRLAFDGPGLLLRRARCGRYRGSHIGASGPHRTRFGLEARWAGRCAVAVGVG